MEPNVRHGDRSNNSKLVRFSAILTFNYRKKRKHGLLTVVCGFCSEQINTQALSEDSKLDSTEICSFSDRDSAFPLKIWVPCRATGTPVLHLW